MGDNEQKFKKLLKKGKFTRSNKNNLETINGLLVEPLNPSHVITVNYVLDRKTMNEIIGRLDFFSLLNINMI